METLISKLPNDKIKINWNKSPIAMSLFKSFITIPLERSTDHLGSSTGWTEWRNEEEKLIIGGGIVGGIELLDSIRYKKNLQNPYNNYCNPFYLSDIMTKEGMVFFKNYYKDEINNQLSDLLSKIENIKESLKFNKEKLILFKNEFESIGS